jgi:hypothetical protein
MVTIAIQKTVNVKSVTTNVSPVLLGKIVLNVFQVVSLLLNVLAQMEPLMVDLLNVYHVTGDV